MPVDLTPRSSLGATGSDGPVPRLDEECRQRLLAIARAALAAATGAADRAALEVALSAARQPDIRAAAFVTLTEEGALRGCIGRLDADQPVALAIAEAAMAAALDDPRFDPVQAHELDRVRIAVSVLGPYRRLADPESFEPGVDGILVERAWHRGLLLPEAATEADLGRHDVLAIACRKAGLAADAWRDPATIVSAFRTERFGGPAISAAGLSRVTGLDLLL